MLGIPMIFKSATAMALRRGYCYRRARRKFRVLIVIPHRSSPSGFGLRVSLPIQR